MVSVRITQFVAVFVATFFLSLEIPTAQAADWVVKRMSGKVWIKPQGAQPASLKSGMVVPARTTITTRRGARVMLVRGKETMMIGPNSVVGIPPQPRKGRTTIYQQAGQVLFDVEKKHVKHFSVETPFLAAVVKGTQFIVSVGSDNATVMVGRGRVAVSDHESGDRTELNRGQSAATGGGLNVSGEGKLPTVKAGRPKAPKVAPPVPSRHVRAISRGNAKNPFKNMSDKWGLTIAPELRDSGYAVNTTNRTGNSLDRNRDRDSDTDSNRSSSDGDNNGGGNSNGGGSSGGGESNSGGGGSNSGGSGDGDSGGQGGGGGNGDGDNNGNNGGGDDGDDDDDDD